MPKNWLSVKVELLAGGHAGTLWPPPGRLLLVGPRHTFHDLADAVNDAFARWDHAHLWAFTLADGRRASLPDPDDDEPVEDAGGLTVAATLEAGAEFRYVFDFGDNWVHRCTVVEAHVDPRHLLGVLPGRPTPYFGWGALPDQYGRRWEDDDGESPVPPPPADGDPMVTGHWPQTRSTAVGNGLTHDDLRTLRAAAARQDPGAVRGLLAGRDPAPLLQHVGETLFAVGLEGLEELARSVERGLRERDDEGDAELADLLAARLGGAVPTLRPVPVDLDEVAELIDGDPHQETGGWVDLQSGEVWPDEVLDNLDEDDRPDVDDDPDRWWHVDCQGSRASWQDRHDFASQLPSGPLRDRLLDALDGRGAFRRFHRTLDGAPDVLGQWRVFGAERERGRARALLAAHGYTPSPRRDRA